MSLRALTGVPEGSPSVTVDGVALAYDRQGSGPPIVCLTAIGHGARDFDAFGDAMTGRFEVICLDWPGHGRSGDDHQPASAARYGELLTGFLEALGIEAPILVGCSIGGAAAIHSAARRPVRGLVLCDSGGLVPVDATVARFCGLFAGFYGAGARRAFWFGPLYAAYYRHLVLPSPAATTQRRRIVAAGKEMGTVGRQAWQSFGRPEADIRGLLAGLGVPVWFAWAAKDRVIPLARCRPAIDATPGARLTTFDAGHAAFLEQPATFADEFLEFAATLEALPASAVA